MKVPIGICDKDCDVARFIFALRNWEELNPYSFYQALTSMNRPDLIAMLAILYDMVKCIRAYRDNC